MLFNQVIINVLRCPEYRARKPSDLNRHCVVQLKHQLGEVASPRIAAAEEQLTGCFQPAVLLHLHALLVEHYMPLSLEELCLWSECPEDYCLGLSLDNSQSGDSWMFCWRPSVEFLYKMLVMRFKPQLAPELMSLVSRMETLSLQDLSAYLLLDAGLIAPGMAEFALARNCSSKRVFFFFTFAIPQS